MDKLKSVLVWIKDHIRIRRIDISSKSDEFHIDECEPKQATEIQLRFDF